MHPASTNADSKANTSDVVVPDVSGMSFADAVTTLKSHGFRVSTAANIRGKEQCFKAVGTGPMGGSKVAKGASIVVSVGPGSVPVPNLVGADSSTLAARPDLACFTVVLDPSNGTGPVAAQSVPAGQSAPDGTTITVSVVPPPTVAQEQALSAAKGYLSMGSGFSAAGLLDQLTSSYGNGFAQADAQWAVDHSGADWNAQAVLAAKGYLNLGGFSRQGMIEQLTSDYGNKFTEAQAEYACDQIGLH
jgi:hypothetical protein